MKSFTTAEKAHDDSDDVRGSRVQIELDGHELTFAKPNSKTLLLLMTIYAEMDSGNVIRALGSSINMMVDLLESEEDQSYIRRRLFDRRDSFGETEIRDIFQYLIEEWSGGPTEEPSDSE